MYVNIMTWLSFCVIYEVDFVYCVFYKKKKNIEYMIIYGVLPTVYAGKCPKPEQFLKAEHLLKHVFPYRDRSFYGPDH